MKKCLTIIACIIPLLISIKIVAAECNRVWLNDNKVGAASSIEQFEQLFAEDKLSYNTIAQRMKLFRVPGASLAYVKGGHVFWAKSYGVTQVGTGQCVEVDTIFSAASISKVATSVMTLLLTQQKKLSLDTDVNAYLKSWQVPSNGNSQTNPVTLRRIMSHTAGLNVHGFRDFQPNEALPNTVQILKGQPPAKNPPIRLIYQPGKVYSYSGGGTTVMQLVIEDVMHTSFEQASHRLLFQPLDMTNSSFATPTESLHTKVAKAHDRFGRATALPRGWESMPEKAASGLWTSAYDLGLMLAELLESYHTKANVLLAPKVIKDMMTAEENSKHGLGPIIDGEAFYHSGANDSYRAYFYGNLATSNGFVILTNSASADSFIDEVQDAMNKMGKY
ncbi:serine hydrolase domain-containing protein [Thalassotalea sediminis]|uniref:serine hydrolase domain-containing protein n=1 Tax=Thalassotalea sediminis TaxID=1759089 RepID=UPI0025724BD7|nr:serine hydrolase domain-containing protein [Thalassotalea sediminis]